MGPGPEAPSWFAVRTRGRHEKKVHRELLQRGVEAFLPLLPRWSQWKDRRQRVEFPLFPGYCFARFILADRLRVLTVIGAAGLVGLDGRPEPIPESEIASVQRLVESRLEFDAHPFLTEGMEVEVVRGPLAGVRGRLVRKDRAASLVLSVSLIRQAAVVHVHPADVRPIAA
jgi:transcription antitermination factor NusG